jgi:hypothetical protein
MNRKLAQVFIGSVTVAVIGYFAFMSYVSSQMSDIRQTTWEAMKISELQCPEGTELKTDGWSKSGYSRTCVNLKHGKWEAWDQGYKNIDGNYNRGKKDGKWIWYHPNGKKYRVIEYDNGIELSNVVISNEP